MLTFHSWHEDALSFDELPTMRDVLLAADPALVADALHRRLVRVSLSRGERPPSLARVWGQTEAAMGEMLRAPVRRPDGEGGDAPEGFEGIESPGVGDGPGGMNNPGGANGAGGPGPGGPGM